MLLGGWVVEGSAGAVARFVGDGVEVGLVAGGGGAFGQVAARGGGWCSRSLRLPKGCGVGEQHARLAVAAPLALVAGHFAPLVPGQGAHRAVGQCADAAGEGARTRSALPAPGEGPPGRGSRWRARPGSPIALAPLLADDQVALPGRRVPPGRQLSGRPPGQPHAHDPGAHNPADGRSTSARPAAGGSTIPCSYEVPPPGWRVDPRVDRLVADRAPIGCWGAST